MKSKAPDGIIDFQSDLRNESVYSNQVFTRNQELELTNYIEKHQI